MLTRLFIDGFKNLVQTEIRFGPLTCIAGFNGVGKSNIFDAIQFLSRLADHPFVEAARATRGGGDLVELFTAGGDGRMHFECDMLIPSRGVDDFHQPAEASQTYLTYELALRLEHDDVGLPRVRLEHERLSAIPRSKAQQQLRFPHEQTWRDQVIGTAHRRRAPFIDMVQQGSDRVVRLSSDKMRDEDKSKRGGGRATEFLARTLPRTVLSAAQNADEARTAVLARAEMRSWRILQLEPSALRRSDDFQAPTTLSSDGAHLPATLHRLASQGEATEVYADIANRLATLVDDVHALRVDRDDTRRALRLVMKDRHGVELPASSLSDGTLRFVALSVLERDPTATGLMCFEEPENGIHPERMDAMMALLADMAVDPSELVDEDNPLRQVIVSTHSPVVAARVRPDELVFADTHDAPDHAPGTLRSLVVRPMADTWRASDDIAPATVGAFLGYLGAVRAAEPDEPPAVEPDRASDFGNIWPTDDEVLAVIGTVAHRFPSRSDPPPASDSPQRNVYLEVTRQLRLSFGDRR